MTRHLVVRAKDGDVFEGTPRSIVHQLHCASLSPEADDIVFMHEAAARALEQTGQFVRDNDADIFIHDLIAAGLLEEMKEAPEPGDNPTGKQDET